VLVSADLLVAEWEKRCGIKDKYVTRDNAGPDVGSAKFGGVLRVSVNNARHFMADDWKTRKPNSDADRNIRVLEAAGLSGPWDRLLADAVLQRLGIEFDAFADALAQTLRDLEPRKKKERWTTSASYSSSEGCGGAPIASAGMRLSSAARTSSRCSAGVASSRL